MEESVNTFSTLLVCIDQHISNYNVQLILGVHVPEDYGSHSVCLYVCLSVCYHSSSNIALFTYNNGMDKLCTVWSRLS